MACNRALAYKMAEQLRTTWINQKTRTSFHLPSFVALKTILSKLQAKIGLIYIFRRFVPPLETQQFKSEYYNSTALVKELVLHFPSTFSTVLSPVTFSSEIHHLQTLNMRKPFWLSFSTATVQLDWIFYRFSVAEKSVLESRPNSKNIAGTVAGGRFDPSFS